MIDSSVSSSLKIVGCVSSYEFVHDARCVVYEGVDTLYTGRKYVFNEDTFSIVDVPIHFAPVQLSKTGYFGVSYTHQGWLATW